MKDIYFVSIVMFLSFMPLVGFIVYAQTQSSIDKVFTKDFCSSENNLLDDILYPDSGQLSYDSSGCPQSIKIIHRWSELSISNKNIIITRMVSNGYIEGEEINSITGEAIR